MQTFDVQVYSDGHREYRTYKMDLSKREAKDLVKELRKKGRKARLVSARYETEIQDVETFDDPAEYRKPYSK